MKKIILLLCIFFTYMATAGITYSPPARKLVYADMHLHENSTATAIDTVSIPHLIQGLFADEASRGWTFSAGSTAAITVFADATGGQVTVTSATHGLSNGGIVSISGTTSYNGIFEVANVTTDTYEITDTWVADDGTGNWYEGDKIVAGATVAGIYSITISGSGKAAIANKNFTFQLYKGVAEVENIHSDRFFSSLDTGTFSATGIVSIVAGDILTMGIINETDAIDFTMSHANIVLHRL